MSHPAIDNLGAAFQDYVDKLGAVAVWGAIDIPGRERIHVGRGARQRTGNDPIRAGDLYQIGSQTKMLCAIAILLLRNDGKVTLDDTAASILDVKIDPRITLRHLIMNTCGLGEYTAGMAWPDWDPATGYKPLELYTLARQQGQPLEPGAAFDYCNTGWVIAAMVIEAVSGERWRSFARRRIFEPLGLTSSYLWGDAIPQDRLARGYFKGPLRADPFDTGETGLSWAFGAGDGMSTHDDMLDLYRALLAPQNAIGVTMKDLTVESAKPAAHPRFALSLGAEYGYGVEKRAWGGRPLWGHPGRTPGYSAQTWADSASGIVVATAYTNVWDATEPGDLQALRYNGPQLATLAVMTAYAVAGGA